MTHPTLRVQDVSLHIDGKTILDRIDFTASEKRIGIVGRNGSGKTSLARVLGGLVAPSSGTVRLAGIDVLNDRANALNVVGMLFQNPDHQILFPTVLEEISFGLKQQGHGGAQAKALAMQSLANFNKQHWATTSIVRLSQGQRHLVCLMAVLAMQPHVMILDEPFAGLDIPTTMQLMRYLDDVEQTLVHISHDPAVLAQYDRVLWLEAGLVHMDGDAQSTLAGFSTQMQTIGSGDDLSKLTD